jgi:anti-sigma factor RsiW
MTEHTCTYGDRRDEALVAYLYEEMEPAERAAFEPHLAACGACRAELMALGGVRTELGRWSPPERGDVLTPRFAPSPQSRGLGWREWPAWAKTAAAVLIGAAALGIANLEVRYDAAGLSVRSGWMAAPAAVPAADAAPDLAAALDARIAAVREELRRELAAQQAAPSRAVPEPRAASRDDAAAAVLRQAQALVAQSESRQQRELALRVAEIKRGVDAQRQTDLVRIERALGIIQSQTGMTAMRQGQMINSLAVKVGQIQ